MDKNIFHEQVKAVIEQVRPSLQQDGGDVELVETSEDGKVTVRLQGACHGCPMAQMTLHLGIERMLKEKVKDFSELIAVD